MLTPDLEALLRQVPFQRPDSARARLNDLAGIAGSQRRQMMSSEIAVGAELLGLAEVSTELSDALQVCADPDRAINNLERFARARGSRLQLYHLFRDHPLSLRYLIDDLAASQYLADILVRNPEYFAILSDTEILRRPKGKLELEHEAMAVCAAFHTEEAMLNALRRFRRREMLRIGTADLLEIATIDQTVEQLSILADVVVQLVLSIVSCKTDPPPIIVLALGKLGGNELNFSSDIDLVLLCPDDVHGHPARIGISLVSELSAHSDEGFLYRVDTRLRPYGSAGPLVATLTAFEDYLAKDAHPAERQAMTKARVIAGDISLGERWLSGITHLIYSNFDRARAQVRELKERIERQLESSRESIGHVKLARGGIRDIEFIAQALQLEHGLTRPEVRTGNTLRALANLVSADILSDEDESQLREAYIFLRTVEHRMQLMNNMQVHRLPQTEEGIRTLAKSMWLTGPDCGSQFRAMYQNHTDHVRSAFERILNVDRS